MNSVSIPSRPSSRARSASRGSSDTEHLLPALRPAGGGHPGGLEDPRSGGGGPVDGQLGGAEVRRLARTQQLRDVIGVVGGGRAQYVPGGDRRFHRERQYPSQRDRPPQAVAARGGLDPCPGRKRPPRAVKRSGRGGGPPPPARNPRGGGGRGRAPP